jgi:hypothetical protein
MSSRELVAYFTGSQFELWKQFQDISDARWTNRNVKSLGYLVAAGIGLVRERLLKVGCHGSGAVVSEMATQQDNSRHGAVASDAQKIEG